MDVVGGSADLGGGRFPPSPLVLEGCVLDRPKLKAGDVIVHGHTHIPVAEKMDNILLYNPGSITFPKGGNVPSYGLFEHNTLKVLSFSDDILKQVCL